MPDRCVSCRAEDGEIYDDDGRPLCAWCALRSLRLTPLGPTQPLFRPTAAPRQPTAPSVWLALLLAQAPGAIALALILRFMACQ